MSHVSHFYDILLSFCTLSEIEMSNPHLLHGKQLWTLWCIHMWIWLQSLLSTTLKTYFSK